MLNFTIFSDNLDYALGWMVVHSLWQATLIAILSGIILIALRKKAAKVRYIVANISLVLVLVAAIVTFFLHYDFSPTPTNIVSNTTLNVVEGDNIPLITNLSDNTEGVQKGIFNISTFKSYFNQHLPLILTVWILGVALFLLRLLGSVSYIYYLKNRMNFPTDEYWTDMIQNLSQKAGLKRAVDLVESAMVRTPVVVGHLKPMILFPIGVINRLDAAEVEAILAHELAHVLRHDYLFNILQSIVEALFYYHPAVWWMSSQIRNERESACDDIAINLINSKMNYAKALVTIQEMAYYPMNVAMGFAGQRKNQFVMRMHRILNIQQNKTNIMEKLIATLLIVFTLFGLTYGQKQEQTPIKQENISQNDDTFIQINDSDRPLSMKGVWQAEIDGNEVCVVFNNNLKGGNWTSTECFDKKEFSELPNVEKEFTITRTSGVMKMKGKFEGNDGYGRFEFTPNNDFKVYLENQGATGLNETTLLHCFFADMNKEFIGFMNEKGYKNLTRRQIEELAIFRMDKDMVNYYLDFFKKSGNNNPALKKLVELKIHGIEKEYIATLQKYGYIDVPIDQVLQAKIHGIDAEYLQTFVKHQSKKYALQDLIQMKIHGADGDYITKIEGNSGKSLDVDDVVNSKIHGLDKIDVDKIEKSTGDKLDKDDLTAFAVHGIDADYIQSLNNAGMGRLSSEDIIAAKVHGITPEYMKSFATMGFKKMNFENVVAAKVQDINPEYVKQLMDIGFKNMHFDDVIAFKIHGASAEYVKGFKNLGLNDLSMDDIIGAKVQGVSAQYIKDFKDLGYSDISIDDAIGAKVQGVTPQYIKSFQEVGIKDLDMDDAIAFKIHGVTPEFVKSLKDNGYSIDTDDVLNKKIRGSSKGGMRSFNNTVKPNVKVDLGDLNINLDNLKINIDEEGIKKAINDGVSASPMGGFIRLLVKDGKVSLNKEVVIKGNKNWLSVDGKKVDEATFQKYRKEVEAKQGRSITNNFRFGFEGKILDVNGDKLRIDGSIETDDN
jgi:beta-lactamase regulating signal transducer with metallopeptidase domain